MQICHCRVQPVSARTQGFNPRLGVIFPSPCWCSIFQQLLHTLLWYNTLWGPSYVATNATSRTPQGHATTLLRPSLILSTSHPPLFWAVSTCKRKGKRDPMGNHCDPPVPICMLVASLLYPHPKTACDVSEPSPLPPPTEECIFTLYSNKGRTTRRHQIWWGWHTSRTDLRSNHEHPCHNVLVRNWTTTLTLWCACQPNGSPSARQDCNHHSFAPYRRRRI
jgi:hypothetical protein